MEQEIQLNEHNKQEYPSRQINGFDTSSIIVYTTKDSQISLEVKMNGDTVWLTQPQLGEKEQ